VTRRNGENINERSVTLPLMRLVHKGEEVIWSAFETGFDYQRFGHAINDRMRDRDIDWAARHKQLIDDAPSVTLLPAALRLLAV
jgi:hypothetical protein